MIRLATSSDRRHLAHIADRAYSKYVKILQTPPAPILLDYARVANEGNTYVLVEGGEICGMVTCSEEKSQLVLRNLAVLPRHQGKGIGRRLADFVEMEARRRNLDNIYLWTREEMVDNINFYLKLGYEIVHTERTKQFARVYFNKKISLLERA